MVGNSFSALSTTACSATTVSQPSSINRLGVHGIEAKATTIIAPALPLNSSRQIPVRFLLLSLSLGIVAKCICKSDKYAIANSMIFALYLHFPISRTGLCRWADNIIDIVEKRAPKRASRTRARVGILVVNAKIFADSDIGTRSSLSESRASGIYYILR